MIGDVNSLTRRYLLGQTALTDLVGGASPRVYAGPLMPEGVTLPAIHLFTRGGYSNPHVPPLVRSSLQITCWAGDPIAARKVYLALYGALQGVENQATADEVFPYTFPIDWPVGNSLVGAIEEVAGQDSYDPGSGEYLVISFWGIIMKEGNA